MNKTLSWYNFYIYPQETKLMAV